MKLSSDGISNWQHSQLRRAAEETKYYSKNTQSRPLVREYDPSPSVVEKTVYIRLCQSDYYGGEMDWYEVKLSSSIGIGKSKRKRGSGREGSPPPFTAAIEPIWKKVETPLWSCCVALGSTIYSVGGGDKCKSHSSQEVRAADMSLRHIRYVAPMNAKRRCPFAVTAGDKIYVFGGLNEEGLEIEVFDPRNNMWEIVTPPSLPTSLRYCTGYFVTYDEAWKRIILGSFSAKTLLAYDGRSWELLDSKFESRLKNNTGVALFEKTLYWICTQREPHAELVVYDMDTKMLGSTIILGLEEFLLDDRYDRPPLFHFRGGNEFYVIWHDSMQCGESRATYQSMVQCARILVSKRVDKQKRKISVEANVVSTKTYLLPRPYQFMDAVVGQ